MTEPLAGQIDAGSASPRHAGARVDRPLVWVLVGAAVPVISIAALAILFLHSVDRAAAYFNRAAVSQGQFGQVLAIRDAARGGDRLALDAALERYRASIRVEWALLSPAERAAQGPELADAGRLAAASGQGRSAALDQLIDRIARREQGEAAEAAAKMADLRSDAWLLALLLAGCAAVSAVIGAAGFATANRRLSRAVAARTAQIAAVDASRRLFFAKVSHELRTPVTSMRGEAEVALANAARDPAGLTAALHEVVAHSELLDRRVEELLALSQADDGRIELMREPVELTDIARAATHRVARHAASNQVRVRLSQDAPVAVAADARWLEQAVVAVLDNAIKFSPEGADVDVTVVHRDAQHAVVTIGDRGRGVAQASLPKLFDAYYQTAEGRARGGNGLGLALSRWIVEQHGGTASASQRDGGGCLVTLTLPVAA